MHRKKTLFSIARQVSIIFEEHTGNYVLHGNLNLFGFHK